MFTVSVAAALVLARLCPPPLRVTRTLSCAPLAASGTLFTVRVPGVLIVSVPVAPLTVAC